MKDIGYYLSFLITFLISAIPLFLIFRYVNQYTHKPTSEDQIKMQEMSDDYNYKII
jgi:large-conductance mechanosensitive channel